MYLNLWNVDILSIPVEKVSQPDMQVRKVNVYFF